jgi:phosphohistidine phosphatase SixA
MRLMQMPALVSFLRGCVFAAFALVAASAGAVAQSLSAGELVTALRQGGYVLVMRHATSPATRPNADTATPGNTRLERQLNENGHKTAKAMGEAFRSLGIVVGEVLSSPTFRTRETAEDLGLGATRTFLELGDGSQGYEVSSFKDSNRFLRDQSGVVPRPGTNTLIITHIPNMEFAFGEEASGIAEGETIVFRPDGRTGARVARIKIEEWPRLTAQP